MNIVPLRQDDIPAILELMEKGAPYVRPRTTSDYWLYANLFSSTCPIATYGNQFMGAVIAFRSQDRPDDVYIQDVITHPDHRRTGVATALLSSVRDRAQRASSLWEADCATQSLLHPPRLSTMRTWRIFSSLFQEERRCPERSGLAAPSATASHRWYIGYSFTTAQADVGDIQESEVTGATWYPLTVAERLVGPRIARAVSAPAQIG